MNSKVYAIILQILALPFGWTLATLWYNFLWRDNTAAIPLIGGIGIFIYAAWQLEKRKDDD